MRLAFASHPRRRGAAPTPRSRRRAAPRDGRWRCRHSPRAPAPHSRAASSARGRAFELDQACACARPSPRADANKLSENVAHEKSPPVMRRAFRLDGVSDASERGQTTPNSQSSTTTPSGTPSSHRMIGIGSLPCVVLTWRTRRAKIGSSYGLAVARSALQFWKRIRPRLAICLESGKRALQPNDRLIARVPGAAQCAALRCRPGDHSVQKP